MEISTKRNKREKETEYDGHERSGRWVPAIGPVLVGGPLAAWIIAGLEDAVVVGGLSAIGAGLFSIGIPKDSIVTYETAIKAGEYLVVEDQLICGTPPHATSNRKIPWIWR